MRLNGLFFDFPICLAPMAGYTDLCFRLLCRRQGADIATTEMISAKGLVYGARATRALLASCPEDQPVIVQLFGREPEILAEAARISADVLGAGLLAVDLNMGCPAPKITGGGEGSALMKEPVLAGRIVAAVRAAISVPVTAKCRIGWDGTQKNAVEFARILEGSGADMLTLHARTREQYYGGRADWDMIARVKAALRIPLIGNGDITSGADALAMRAETGCDGVAVGRAALGNPWIFSEIHAELDGTDYLRPVEAVRRAGALEHARMALEAGGPHALIELRKHLAWYIRGVPGAAALRVQVNAAQNYEQLAEILS